VSGAAPDYAFRDSQVAATRLDVVAELFEDTSRSFLGRFAGRPAGIALDLGCGPGHTTKLLAEVLRPERTIGLDVSPRFLAVARAEHPGLEFVEHDVTAVPFPTPPPDTLSCRFLLSHLAGLDAVLEGWAGELRPGGLLLVEEVEWIGTGEPTFGRYLEVVRGLLAARGHRLEVGPALAEARPSGLRTLSSTVAILAPDPQRVASAFLLNLRAWGDDPEIAGPLVEELGASLARMAAGGAARSIRWGLRQLAYEKRRQP
jgi:trans-aconitate 2-methyltransferase